jgi:hypothetical protein
MISDNQERAMKRLLLLAAFGEAAAGLLLLVYPPIVIRLLFGAEIAGAGIIMTRIAGISLIALGMACWPGNMTHRALYGMFTYSTSAMLYLAYIGVTGLVGILLWPAVAVHAGLSILLFRTWWKQQRPPSAGP